MTPRKLSERTWFYRARELHKMRAFLRGVIGDEEVELSELLGKVPDDYVLEGIARRTRRLSALRTVLHELPDMALNKKGERI